MEQRHSFRLVTAYQKSDVYDDEYVGRLSDDFYRHHSAADDAVFHVVEDERWPGWWCKMAALQWIAQQDQPWYFSDLDNIITGQLPDPGVNSLVVNHDFYSLQLKIQSGFMYIAPRVAGYIFDRFAAKPDHVMEKFRGDGDFIRFIAPGAVFWREVAPGQVVSWKVHCMNERPADARVVCYHGKPSPRETRWSDSGSSQHCKLPNPDRYLSA